MFHVISKACLKSLKSQAHTRVGRLGRINEVSQIPKKDTQKLSIISQEIQNPKSFWFWNILHFSYSDFRQFTAIKFMSIFQNLKTSEQLLATLCKCYSTCLSKCYLAKQETKLLAVTFYLQNFKKNGRALIINKIQLNKNGQTCFHSGFRLPWLLRCWKLSLQRFLGKLGIPFFQFFFKSQVIFLNKISQIWW